MANPMPGEDQVYEKIKQEKITIHPDIRELINHHVRNDVNWISLLAGDYKFVPQWILKVCSWQLKFLYWVTRQPGDPPADFITFYKGTIRQVKNVDIFLKKLFDATDANEDKTKKP
jgi:hypothetical protein